ncbi:MAG: efflux RND transporter periplasmic adaptor subunit [Faecalibacterium sp.]
MLWKKPHDDQNGQKDLSVSKTPPAGTQKALAFGKRHWKKIAALLCAAAVAVAVLLPRIGTKSVSAGIQYMETVPQTRSITNTFSGTGTLSAANTYTVKSLVKGTVLTADFAVGDTIEKGAVLYTIDSSDVSSSVQKAELSLRQAQQSYADAEKAAYVCSSIAGTVVSLNVKAGDFVKSGQEIATIRDSSSLLLALEFPAADAAQFSTGQAAQILVDSTFETLEGTVISISGADTLNNGSLLTRTVTIAVANPGSLTTAQAATASVNGISALGSARFTCQREQTVTASASGTVAALCVRAGEWVGVDTALMQLSSSELTKQLRNAADSLTSAELSMSDTQKQMENYTITSPISGTVISKSIKEGDTVNSSATSETMCIINDLSYLEITLNVDELDILSIKEGQSARITADAISGQTFEGVVTSVSTAGTTNGGTTTYPVTIRLNETGDLLPGMNATAEIMVDHAENALSIPNGAVVRGGYVLVTQDSPSAANAAREMTAPEGYVYVKVETGISDDDYIEVLSGLTAQDTIAYDPSLAFSSDSMEMDFRRNGGGMPGGGGPGGGF